MQLLAPTVPDRPQRRAVIGRAAVCIARQNNWPDAIIANIRKTIGLTLLKTTEPRRHKRSKTLQAGDVVDKGHYDRVTHARRMQAVNRRRKLETVWV
eukprot:scaffold187112_cov19-Prasinocladus_malaysianus.AAC.2